MAVHNSVLVTDFLTKMDIKTFPQLPYSQNLAPCDFWLFPKLRGCRYETIEEINEAVTRVIDTLTQEDFHGPIRKKSGNLSNAPRICTSTQYRYDETRCHRDSTERPPLYTAMISSKMIRNRIASLISVQNNKGWFCNCKSQNTRMRANLHKMSTRLNIAGWEK